MPDPQTIKEAFERNANAIKRKPSIGHVTATTKIRVTDETTCEIRHGDWRMTCDMGVKQGGNNAGPGPGIYERAALGSCLAMGYALWAARRGVPIEKLEVDVESDADAAGQYGVADVPAGFSALRYHVTIQSPASESEIIRVLDEADAHSPVRSDFSRAIPIERDVRIVAGADQ